MHRALLILIAVLSLTPFLRAQHPTLREITRAVTSARAQIQDLTLTFTFNAAPRATPTDNLFARSQMTVTAKQEQLFIDHTYGADPLIYPALYHLISSYDGDRSFVEIRKGGVSSFIITSGRERAINTQGLGFFDVMMYNPTSPGSTAFDCVDLVSLLKSPVAALRPDLEEVDGRMCSVVDWTFESGRVGVTVWLDPRRGFLPIRQRYFTDVTPSRLATELSISDAAEISPGLWMPVAGRKVSGAMINDLAVERTAAGAPAITLNYGVNPQVFDRSQGIPRNAVVVDTSGRYTVRHLMRWLAITVTAVVVIMGALAVYFRTCRNPKSGAQSAS